MLKILSKPKPPPAPEPESGSSEEEEIEEEESSSDEQPPPAPKKVNGAKVVINQSPLVDKINKLEGALAKFTELKDLIASLQENSKFLQNLRLTNLDELKKLEKLQILDGVTTGLKSLEKLQSLSHLAALSKLEKLDRLDTFSDERINQVFINMAQLNDKIQGPLNKVGDINSKIDILNISLKPFRESGITSKLMEIPDKVNGTIAGISGSLEDISSKINLLGTSNNTEVITSLNSLEKNVNNANLSLESILKNSAQLSDLSLIEDKLIKKIEELRLYIDQRDSSGSDLLDVVNKIVTSNGEFSTKLETELKQINSIGNPVSHDDIINKVDEKLLGVAEDIKNEIIKEVLQVKHQPSQFDKIEELKEIRGLIDQINGKLQANPGLSEHPEDLLNQLKEVNSTIAENSTLVINKLDKLDLNTVLSTINLNNQINAGSFSEIKRILSDNVMNENKLDLINKKLDLINSKEMPEVNLKEINRKLDEINNKEMPEVPEVNLDHIVKKLDEINNKEPLKVPEVNLKEVIQKLDEIRNKEPPKVPEVNLDHIVKKLDTLITKEPPKVSEVNLDHIVQKLDTLISKEPPKVPEVNLDPIIQKLDEINSKDFVKMAEINLDSVTQKLNDLISNELNINSTQLFKKLDDIYNKEFQIDASELIEKLNNIEGKLNVSPPQLDLSGVISKLDNLKIGSSGETQQVDLSGVISKLNNIESKLNVSPPQIDLSSIFEKLDNLKKISNANAPQIDLSGVTSKLDNIESKLNVSPPQVDLSSISNKLNDLDAKISSASPPQVDLSSIASKLDDLTKISSASPPQVDLSSVFEKLNNIETKISPPQDLTVITSRLDLMNDKFDFRELPSLINERLSESISGINIDNHPNFNIIINKLDNIVPKLNSLEDKLNAKSTNSIFTPLRASNNEALEVKMASIELSNKTFLELLNKINGNSDPKSIVNAINKSHNVLDANELTRYNELVTKISSMEKAITDLSTNFASWANSLTTILNEKLFK